MRWFMIFGTLASFAIAGCDSSVETADNADSAAGPASSSGSQGQGGNPCWPDSCSGPSSGSAGAGGSASCSLADPCRAGEYCDYGDNHCGERGGLGKCRLLPLDCGGPLPEPTCGCDGTVHDNECMANLAGTDVSFLPSCMAPPGSFACGAIFCDEGIEYCERTTSDIGGTPDSYLCVTVPSRCGSAIDCLCLAAEPCSALCEEVSSGDFMLTCPGG